MLINNSNPVNFGVNLNSKKLRFKNKDFYVNIPGYGKNFLWAKRTIKTADEAVSLTRQEKPAEEILKFISTGIAKANKFCFENYKRKQSGFLRCIREGWESVENPHGDLITSYEKNRYSSYRNRLDMTCWSEPIICENNEIGVSRPTYIHTITHGNPGLINSSLDYVFKLSKNILPKYLNKEVKPENLKEINDTMAEIRWVLAHSTPWVRGSDAISNVFMRVLYKAIGIKTYPLEKGVSLDLEAYCTQLEDYKEEFPYYFEKPPEIIE